MTWWIALAFYLGAATLFYTWMVRRATLEEEKPLRENWVMEYVEEERHAA